MTAFLLLAGAVAGQVLAGRLTNRAGNLLGLGLMPVGVVVLIVAVVAKSLPLLVVAVLVAGLGVGFAFRASLGKVVSIAPAERRGEVTSTYFAGAYLGLTIPVVGSGLLVTETSLVTAVVGARGVRRRVVRGRRDHRRPLAGLTALLRRGPARLPRMVLEVALINVTPARRTRSPRPTSAPATSWRRRPDAARLRMTRGIESPSRFVLLVEWDSVDAHEDNFRGSDRFTQWRAAIGPFFDGPPDVQHATDVDV